jgi:hypothetical protein
VPDVKGHPAIFFHDEAAGNDLDPADIFGKSNPVSPMNEINTDGPCLQSLTSKCRISHMHYQINYPY